MFILLSYIVTLDYNQFCN